MRFKHRGGFLSGTASAARRQVHARYGCEGTPLARKRPEGAHAMVAHFGDDHVGPKVRFSGKGQQTGNRPTDDREASDQPLAPEQQLGEGSKGEIVVIVGFHTAWLSTM